MSKLLIIGASGFLGRNLLATDIQFSGEILTPSSKELDLLDLQSTDQYFQTNSQIDNVIFLAANCGGIGKNKDRPFDLTHQNLKMIVNIFDMIKKYQVKYFVGFGSVCSYPIHCPIPFKEDDMWNGKEELTNRGYGESKRMLINEFQAYKEQYGLKGCILVPTNMYGAFDHTDARDSHVVPALISKFSEAKLNNSPSVECWGSGSATRDLIACQDVCEALNIVLRKQIDYKEPINLGTGSDISIYDLAHLISELMEYKGEIIFLNDSMDGQPKRLLDVSRSKLLLGWKSTTSLREGLMKTITWYQENQSSL